MEGEVNVPDVKRFLGEEFILEKCKVVLLGNEALPEVDKQPIVAGKIDKYFSTIYSIYYRPTAEEIK